MLLASYSAYSQATATVLRKDLKKDFGAVGDGRTNDNAAFSKAADFFNQRAQTPAGASRAILTIPKGTYLVGQQDVPGTSGITFQLVGCRNLTIEGADSANTKIRYASDLRYGSFDPATHKPYEAPTAFFTDHSYAMRAGNFLGLLKCDNVVLSGLDLDGNSANLLVGGHWGDTGIQLPADGIFISDSRHITFRRLAVHHFGRDGIQILNHLAKSLDSPEQEGILLENSTFNYNGRQGLSITGVNGLRASNCRFNHTGRVQVQSLGKALFSAPGAGVDLEPQDGFVTNVRFDNCQFVDNAGQGIVADRVGSRTETMKNILVVNSLIWGTTNWSAWVTQPGFLFQNCRIYGAFVHGCRAARPADATRFVGCTFEDKPYHGQPPYGIFTLHSDAAARYMSFTDCRFVGNYSYLIWAIVSKPSDGGAPDTASFFHLRRCTFLYDYTQPTQGSYDNLQGAVFTGVNTFRDGPHRTSQHYTRMTLGNGAASGSTVVRAPGSLQLLASNCAYHVVAGLDIGRGPARTRDSASVIVGPGNALLIKDLGWTVTELYIGPTSRLVIKKGASLEVDAHTKVTIAGQLVVEDGAYFYVNPATPVATVGRGRLQLAPKAIKGRRPS
ncbi:hypothetical protein GCM10023172_05100 [Hymenobacter ginsengisoli]|uniref:Pectate lyase superfamily protein domain-containing protein n=2 Tax=Hymenobacteraceae TaxID=1853232 RepID=A0ABP8Q0E6_9BACT